MSKRLRWLSIALDDLEQAVDYLAQHNVNAARDLAGRIYEAVNLLKDNPEAGRPGREEVMSKFERRYWITSDQFFELYSEGLLDDGEHAEDFSEWAGFLKLKQRRESAVAVR